MIKILFAIGLRIKCVQNSHVTSQLKSVFRPVQMVVERIMTRSPISDKESVYFCTLIYSRNNKELIKVMLATKHYQILKRRVSLSL